MTSPRPALLRPALLRPVLLLCLALCIAPALAQTNDEQPLPAWEQLSAADRDALIAPIRERWNANPDQRARLKKSHQTRMTAVFRSPDVLARGAG